ncbi:hypothetical protein GCU60_18480 [Blastococcus saxobsidens]|uniref:Uncharacterized protein n=1 Tax=Blastococcus saxobsidens TaxID=138336 RepID=A0A6L9W7E5_9ACTN|nr:hypothetical protein [Blastococcus saxobsidens]NEK87729.1 hypothetical protein [Blastococcus saxobsidens]
MTAAAPPTELPTSTLRRALGHVVLAGVLGVFAGMAATPLLGASLFGRWPAVLIAAAVVVCLSTVAAAALDRAAGPGALGRPGAVLRGVVVGGLGSAAAMGVALWAIQTPSDVADVLPVPLRFAAVALPFAVLAGLQWPGAVRIGTAVLLVAGTAAVVVPAGTAAVEEGQAERIATEVGTTEHPWVSEVDGYRLSASQVTGSPLIWTRLERDDLRPDAVLWLFRDQPVDPATSDPCAAFSLWTPGGDQPITSCTQVGDGAWLRGTGSWQELARFDADVRVGVTADPGVERAVLEAALDAARPMTDAEYETWLDEGMTPGW